MKKVKELNDTLPVYKKINDILLDTKAITRNQAGKIIRYVEMDKIKEIGNSSINDGTDEPSNIETIVKNIIKEQLEIEEVSLESDFLSDLGADSLDMVTIFFNLEKKLGIKIEKEKRKSIKTVYDLVNLLKE